jgi:hypothetical protein
MKVWRKAPAALFRGKDPGARTGGSAKGLWKLWITEEADFTGNLAPILQSRNL